MNKLLSYSMDFTSFLLENIKIDDIKNIILFGSVSREESGKESDIDIFIDVVGSEKYYKDAIEIIQNKFFESSKFLNYWSAKGIDNNFSIIVGKLDEWRELKNSIISNGISLFSKFKDIPENMQYKVLFSFEKIKPESRRVIIFKKLFGYKRNNKTYIGLIKKYNGLKISSGSIIIPLEYYNIFNKLFREYSIKVKIIKFMEYN